MESLVEDGSLKLEDKIVYVGSSYGIRGMASFLEIIEVKSGIAYKSHEDVLGSAVCLE